MGDSMNKKIIKCLLLILLFIFVCIINVVYADAVADVSFCESPGVLRTMKIIGILLVLVKVLLPIILIIMSIIDFGKSAVAGNAEDLKKNAITFLKRCAAGAIILVLPTFINYIFDNLVDRGSDAEYRACATCILNTSECDISGDEPDYYRDN